jgi:mRNA deadenylase 3'-5' endonuclease subunit Ccr4
MLLWFSTELRDCRLNEQVQSTHFADFWAPELGKAGYTAIFKKKTAEVPVAEFSRTSTSCSRFLC